MSNRVCYLIVFCFSFRCLCHDLTRCHENLNSTDRDVKSSKTNISWQARTVVMVRLSVISHRSMFYCSFSTSFLSGDVDSCDDNEFEDDDDKLPISQRMRNRRTNNLNKNRLHSNSPFNNINPNIMTQKQYQNSYNLRAGNIKVNNLDLINGCIDSRYEITNQNAGASRQGRSRMFGQKTFNRHETKL